MLLKEESKRSSTYNAWHNFDKKKQKKAKLDKNKIFRRFGQL